MIVIRYSLYKHDSRRETNANARLLSPVHMHDDECQKVWRGLAENLTAANQALYRCPTLPDSRLCSYWRADDILQTFLETWSPDMHPTLGDTFSPYIRRSTAESCTYKIPYIAITAYRYTSTTLTGLALHGPLYG